jgi:predicted Fe-Mo cluster-binding NifX family protein
MVISIDNGSEIDRENVFLGDISTLERCRIFQDLGIAVIICSGISETFEKILQNAKFKIINGIAGDVQKVLTAYLKDGLNKPEFYMPGFKDKDRRL